MSEHHDEELNEQGIQDEQHPLEDARWVDDVPPPRRGRGGAQQETAIEQFRAIVAMCRKNPGRWIEFPSKDRYQCEAWRRASKKFAGVEFTCRISRVQPVGVDRDHRLLDVYVRAVQQ